MWYRIARMSAVHKSFKPQRGTPIITSYLRTGISVILRKTCGCLTIVRYNTYTSESGHFTVIISSPHVEEFMCVVAGQLGVWQADLYLFV